MYLVLIQAGSLIEDGSVSQATVTCSNRSRRLVLKILRYEPLAFCRFLHMVVHFLPEIFCHPFSGLPFSAHPYRVVLPYGRLNICASLSRVSINFFHWFSCEKRRGRKRNVYDVFADEEMSAQILFRLLSQLIISLKSVDSQRDSIDRLVNAFGSSLAQLCTYEAYANNSHLY